MQNSAADRLMKQNKSKRQQNRNGRGQRKTKWGQNTAWDTQGLITNGEQGKGQEKDKDRKWKRKHDLGGYNLHKSKPWTTV